MNRIQTGSIADGLIALTGGKGGLFSSSDGGKNWFPRPFAYVSRVVGLATNRSGDWYSAVDFIRMYADRTHHGKEEDILFGDLSKRLLSAEDQRIMKDLLEEHIFGRQTTKALIEANTRYRNGDESAFADIVSKLHTPEV